MSELDRALNVLKSQPEDSRLDGLEPAVWLDIEAGRRIRATSAVFLPIRAAAVCVALAMGTAAGGLAAAQVSSERQEISVFSIDSHLAPSTLLDEKG